MAYNYNPHPDNFTYWDALGDPPAGVSVTYDSKGGYSTVKVPKNVSQVVLSIVGRTTDYAGYTLSGAHVRRNDNGGYIKQITWEIFTGGPLGYTYRILDQLESGIFPVGKWVTIPNMKLETKGEANDTQIILYLGAGANFSFYNWNIFNNSDAPAGAVIDANDASFTMDAAVDSLDVTFHHSDPNELVQLLRWNFGDGSPELYNWYNNGVDIRNPKHTYPTAGTYEVTCTAYNMMGQESQLGTNMGINQTAPHEIDEKVPAGDLAAQFEWQATYLNVNVDATESTGAIIDDYEWDWGDGSPTDNGKIQSHTFAAGGDWPVTLTVTNHLGQSNAITIPVTTVDIPQVPIDFTFSKNLLEVNFTHTVDSDDGTYEWDFGDGGTSTHADPFHFYALAGTYTVTLTETIGGVVSSISHQITVKTSLTPIESFIDALRLEVKKVPGPNDLVNLVKNPNGELGGYGWVTPTAQGKVDGLTEQSVGSYVLQFTGGGEAEEWHTELAPMQPNQYVAAYWLTTLVQNFYRMWFRFYDNTATEISDGPLSAYKQASGAGQRSSIVQAPAGTAWVSLHFALYFDNAGANPYPFAKMQYTNVAMAVRDNHDDLLAYTYSDQTEWINLIGYAFEIGINRSELQIGTLTASVRNSAYDPSRQDVDSVDEHVDVRPGQEIRLRAQTEDELGNAIWEPIYWGKVQNALVTYDRPKIITVPGSPGQIARVIRTNVCANPNFETDLTGWSLPFYCTIAQDNTHVHSGNHSLLATSTTLAASSSMYFFYGLTPGGFLIIVNPGDRVNFSGFVYSEDAGQDLAVNAIFYDAENNILQNTTDSAITDMLAGEWNQFVSDDVMAPAGAALCVIAPVNTVLHPTQTSFTSSDATGWLTYGTNSKIETVNLADGSAVHCSSTAAGTNNGASTNNFVPLPAGTPITLTADVMVPVTNNRMTAVNMLFRDDPNNNSAVIGSGNHLNNIAADGQFHTVSISGTVLAGFNLTRVYISQYPSAEPGAGYDFYFRNVALKYQNTLTKVWYDDVMIEINRDTTVEDTSYFDGNTPNDDFYTYAWLGTANWSQSTKTTVDIPATETEYIVVNDPVRTVVQLTAIDNVSTGAQENQPLGVENIYDLPYIMEGMGIPYIINGFSGQVTTAQLVSYNADASLIDQVSITRDTQHGYAFVNRSNVLIAYDRENQPMTVAGVFDEGAYSDIDINFNTDNCINQVMVNWNRFDPESLETTSVQYGPYMDQESIDQWGVHSATFTIQGNVENPSYIEAFANDVIAANGTPKVQVNSITLPISHQEDITVHKAILDLYDLVEVKYAQSSYDENLRITGIQHSISTSGWVIQYLFSVDGAVASPQVTPPPTGPLDQRVEVPPVVCTSTTRPDYEAGLIIFETDTGKLYIGGQSGDFEEIEYRTPSWTALPNPVATNGYAVTSLKYQKAAVSFAVCWQGTITNNSGSDLSVNGDGTLTDIVVAPAGTVPNEMCPSSAVYLPMYQAGVNTFWGRIGTDGSITITNGMANALLPDGGVLKIQAVVPLI